MRQQGGVGLGTVNRCTVGSYPVIDSGLVADGGKSGGNVQVTAEESET